MAANVLVDRAMVVFNKLDDFCKSRIKIKLRCKSTDNFGVVRTKFTDLDDWTLVNVYIEEMEVLEKESDITKEET